MAQPTDAHEHLVVALTSSDLHLARFMEKGTTIFTRVRLIMPRNLWTALGKPDELTLTISAGDHLGLDDG